MGEVMAVLKAREAAGAIKLTKVEPPKGKK
jgi:hypothetical protein